MKGIMVPLLILMTTGIVVGQQSNSSDSFNQTASTQAPFGPRSSNDLLKPLEIPVGDNIVSQLRQGKVLNSKIAPKDRVTGKLLDPSVVNGVMLFTDGKNPSDLNKQTVTPTTDGNGTLEFALTERDLQLLGNGQLKYDLPSSERGKYHTIKVYNVEAQERLAVENARPSSNNSFNQSSRTPIPDETGGRSFGPPSQRRESAASSLIPLPSPEPGDINFVGPARPPGQWSPQNATAQRNPLLDPPLDRNNNFGDNNFAGNNNQTKNEWSLPNTGATQNDKFDLGQWQRDQQLKEEQERAAKEREYAYQQQLQRQQQIDAQAQRNRIAQAERDRIAKAQADREWLAKVERDRIAQAERDELNRGDWRNGLDPRTPLRPLTNGLGSGQDDQVARMTQREYELLQKERLLESRESSLIRKESLVAEKELQYYRDQELRTQRPQEFTPTRNINASIQYGDHYLPPRQVVQKTSERYASRGPVPSPVEGMESTDNRDIANPGLRGGVKDLAASIPYRNSNVPNLPNATERDKFAKDIQNNLALNENDVATKRDDRIDGFILFMLLCSLGLNIYLAFISRGFYVRYNELADELRDTFSATL